MRNPFKDPIQGSIICGCLVFLAIVVTFGILQSCSPRDNRELMKQTLYTVEHDEHTFVVYSSNYQGGLTHHPSCECLFDD